MSSSPHPLKCWGPLHSSRAMSQVKAYTLVPSTELADVLIVLSFGEAPVTANDKHYRHHWGQSSIESFFGPQLTIRTLKSPSRKSMHYSHLLPDVLTIAEAASQKVLAIYQTNFKVEFKSDNSPLTAADLASHHIIVDGLRRLSHEIPVLSEESASAPWSERRHWHRFWLVDPIDGTKDFAKRTGEFTVNIALIEHGEPVLGVVTAPALKEVYWGAKGEGAWKRDRVGRERRISVVVPPSEKRVVASKSHLNEETKAFIEALGPHTLVQAGSSLKFCKIAEGRADIYPRLGPTCEWDTGAAHAILSAAGGKVQTLEGSPLVYGKEDTLNPYFVASGKWY